MYGHRTRYTAEAYAATSCLSHMFLVVFPTEKTSKHAHCAVSLTSKAK